MSAAALTAERCLHHPLREAVARCVGCRRFFCRECITEYNDQIVCSACLQAVAGKSERTQWKLRRLFAPAQIALGIVIAWLFFYFVGGTFILIPTRYHEGTVWLSGEEVPEE